MPGAPSGTRNARLLDCFSWPSAADQNAAALSTSDTLIVRSLGHLHKAGGVRVVGRSTVDVALLRVTSGERQPSLRGKLGGPLQVSSGIARVATQISSAGQRVAHSADTIS